MPDRLTEQRAALIADLRRMERETQLRVVAIWLYPDTRGGRLTGSIAVSGSTKEEFTRLMWRSDLPDRNLKLDGEHNNVFSMERPFTQPLTTRWEKISSTIWQFKSIRSQAALIDPRLVAAFADPAILRNVMAVYTSHTANQVSIDASTVNKIVPSHSEWARRSAEAIRVAREGIAGLSTVRLALQRHGQGFATPTINLPELPPLPAAPERSDIRRAGIALAAVQEDIKRVCNALSPFDTDEARERIRRNLAEAVFSQINDAPGISGIPQQHLMSGTVDLQGNPFAPNHPIFDLDQHFKRLSAAPKPAAPAVGMARDFRL